MDAAEGSIKSLVNHGVRDSSICEGSNTRKNFGKFSSTTVKTEVFEHHSTRLAIDYIT